MGDAVDTYETFERSNSFTMDSTRPNMAGSGFEQFRRGYAATIGASLMPPISAPDSGDFRVRATAGKLRDIAIIDLHGESPIRTGGPFSPEDRVRLTTIRLGEWSFVDSEHHSYALPAGQFMLHYSGHPLHFILKPPSTATVLDLPAAPFASLIGERRLVGSAAAPELRMTVAQARITLAALDDLSPAGLNASREALVELVRAVALGKVDDTEPRLTPALVDAARELVDRHLTDPELSPAMLARELNVSVRTLHRAFSTSQESVTSHIRERRLERAREELGKAYSPSVSEVAARWQFADASHFIRSFTKRYQQTPARYARAARESIFAREGVRPVAAHR